MKSFIKLALISFGVLFLQTSIAQVNYNAYKKFNYKWQEPPPPAASVIDAFAGDDVVYIDDRQLVSVGGSLGSISNIVFQRKARLKFLTEKGVKEHSTLTLPESLDPLYDYHNNPFKNNAIKKGPSYFESTLTWFAARIIRPDGSVKEAVFTDEFREHEVLSMVIKQSVTYKYFKSNYWNFIFSNLQPGDELEYDYQLMVPYPENFLDFNSGRIFFHGEIPRQQYSLLLKYKTGPAHVIKFINNAEPDSVVIHDNVKHHYWTRKELHGGLDEPGARPYTSLPYIIYSLNTEYDFFRYNDAVTAKFKYIPYWLFLIRVRESFDYSMRKNAAIELKDKQNLMIDAFIRNKTEGVADTMYYHKFIKVHNAIADSFKYSNDEALFREEENRGERMGEFTAAYKIRETSRHKLYAKILNKLKLDYFTLYLMDKRYGKINADYQSPMWNNEALYAIYLNGNFAMVHPKKSDNGWYVEELPFYWEHSTGLLLNYNDLFYDLAEKPRILNTVPSTLNDNIRMCNVKAEVNTEKNTIAFDAKVSLAGQYSTMTRFLYTTGIPDSVNNPLYNKKISDINGNAKVLTKDITKRNTSFPFNFDVRTTYESNTALIKNGDGTYSVDLGGWFNHIIYENFESAKRQLDFYPDFVGQDTYRYYIKFDKPVNLVSGMEQTTLQNSMGNITIKLTQPQPDALLVESFFVTIADVIPADKIHDVEAIYKAISKLNGTVLKVSY